MHLFQQQHQQIRNTSRGAAISLIACAEGYRAMGSCAARVRDIPGVRTTVLIEDEFDDFLEVTVPWAVMPEAVKRLTAAGHSVALLDYTPGGGGMKACPVLVCIVPAAKREVVQFSGDKDALALKPGDRRYLIIPKQDWC